MSIQISTLRPGLLVSLSTSVSGNVKYNKRVIEGEYVTENGEQKAKWETERTIVDPVEYERAKKARTKARTIITAICAQSTFGLLCPEAAAEELEKAITEARKVADEFNAGAMLTRVYVYVLTGRIAPDDVEAVRAINSEIRELMEDMERGVKNLDVKGIRDAANRAREMGSMLSPDAAARVQIAIEAARGAARKIVQAGEQAAAEVDTRAIRSITEARTAFLDMGDAVEVANPAAEQRTFDLAPEAPIAAPQAVARSIDME